MFNVGDMLPEKENNYNNFGLDMFEYITYWMKHYLSIFPQL